MKKCLIACAVVAACLTANAQHQLVKLWETDSVLKVPESVLYDAAHKLLYVSNIDGEPWGKDGKGSIGKVGLDGKIIAVDWVTGLQTPKGMALYKNKLYVADYDRIAVIDVNKKAIVQSIPVPGAERLNDVTVDKNGIVYVSESRLFKVYRIENGQPTVWLENLKGTNGLLVHDDQLYVLDNHALYRVEKDKTLTKLADGMEGSVDGLVHVKGNEFLVSIWQGSLYYVNGDGTTQHLLDSREQKINTADIDFDVKRKILYVPTFFKNSIVAYELK